MMKKQSLRLSEKMNMRKDIRRELLKEVFSNATLADMAAKAPRTMEDFLEVSGVGEIKAARYGEAFLKAIAAYEEADEA